MPTLSQIAFHLRARGVRGLLAKVVTRYAYGREQWYVLRNPLSAWSAPGPDPDGLEYRLARAEDLPALARFGRQEDAVLRAWLRPGYWFFLALDHGSPVAWRCVSTRPHAWVAPFFSLAADQLYAVDVFTDPAWRRRGLMGRIIRATNPALEALGCRETVTIQRTDNESSVIATTRHGLLRLGTLVRTRMLWRVRFEFHRHQPGASYRLPSGNAERAGRDLVVG